jgi:hypothetical protein
MNVTKILSVLLFSIPMLLMAQSTRVVKGLPSDLDSEKIIFFKHEKVDVTADRNGDDQDEYVHLRQTNHNKVIKEANEELTVAAMDYPFDYAISTKSKHEPLLAAGYRYILDSRVYANKHLTDQPGEDELIVFEYFIVDTQNDVAYKAFELDEMKVYDSKMLIRRLNRALMKEYRDSY